MESKTPKPRMARCRSVVGKKGDSTFVMFCRTHCDHVTTRGELLKLMSDAKLEVWTSTCPCGDYLVVKVDNDSVRIPDIVGEVFGRVGWIIPMNGRREH